MESNVKAFIGNLGRDPEKRYTKNGEALTKFSIGIKQGNNTKWLNCAVWGESLAKITEGLIVGDEVKVEGFYSEGSYTNRSGDVVPTYDLNTRCITFIQHSQKQKTNAKETTGNLTGTDDPPF